MAKNESIKINSELNKSINNALDLLKNGDFVEASNLFSYVLRLKYDSDIAEFGITTCKYWISRFERICKVCEGLEQGSFLFEQWQKFEDFYKEHKRQNERVINATMFCIYSKALEQLQKDINAKKNNNLHLIFMSGLAYKKIGDYKNALISFERYLSFDNSDCNVLVQLADTYMLLEKVPQAKVLFREAFSNHPEKINLDKIDCVMMKNLIEATKKAEPSCNDSLLKYWIAVYGWLYGILNVYREMSLGDVTKLTKEATMLEKDIELSFAYDAMLVARLLNTYFWLYDYYSLQKVDNQKLAEIEKKMKKISYNLYIIFKQRSQETK